MKKKIFSVFISVLLVLMIFPFSVLASDSLEFANTVVASAPINTGVRIQYVLPVILLCLALITIVFLIITRKK
ncbi:MAG: hypothetical protein IJD88_08120 [Clostridia bacterium]|nr:hypothetical protein [Clostridia bacterium]